MSCIGVTGLLRHTNHMLSADRYGDNTCYGRYTLGRQLERSPSVQADSS